MGRVSTGAQATFAQIRSEGVSSKIVRSQAYSKQGLVYLYLRADICSCRARGATN